MDETRRSDEGTPDAELKQPDDTIKDLEPDEHEGEGVKGGAVDTFIKLDDNYKH